MLRRVLAGACAACCAGILVLAGCSVKLLGTTGFTILYSNDVRGEFENCGCDDVQLGGLSRKAHLLRSAARQTTGLIRLDAGNLFFQKKSSSDIEAREFLLKADFILEAYNAMGCDALNIGDGEFTMGYDALARLRSKASFPFVSSNIVTRDGGQPVFEPYVLKSIAGTRVAILGVCLQDSVFVPNLRIEDPAAAVRKMAAVVRGKSDFLIVLSSLGLERDRELARQAPGINLIISARADRLFEKAVMENGTAIVQAYTRGQYLGRVDVERTGESFFMDNRLIALKPGIGEERDIVDMGRTFKAQVASMNQQAFFKGQPEQPGAGGGVAAYAGADACSQCHIPQYENWRSTPHARAYQTLVGKGSQYAVECLVCHTTGYGGPGGYAPSRKEQSAMINVQCESCHGPGSRHEGSKSGIVRDGRRQVCLGCHTEKNSPRFDYDVYLPLVKCPTGENKH
jgi:predicted CXXCH cytochrome family protein